MVETGTFAASGTNNYETIYTVGSQGSTIQRITFGWNEIPWLYLNLPNSFSREYEVTISWWSDPIITFIGYQVAQLTAMNSGFLLIMYMTRTTILSPGQILEWLVYGV